MKGEPDQGSLSSPRPWRCFQDGFERLLGRGVFSTSVEVFLDRFVPSKSASSLLHVRGGVSKKPAKAFALTGSSPRPWRCFLREKEIVGVTLVFSTSVEVFPEWDNFFKLRLGLLHVRGGVSALRGFLVFGISVFSTSVEVFPRNRTLVPTMCSLLHVHGGVSVKPAIWPMRPLSSPRPWRCLNISVPGVVVVYSRELNGANCS